MLENTLSSGSDSLSVALSKMKLRAFNNVALDAGGTWAIDFPAYDGFTLKRGAKGECRLAIEGRLETIHLERATAFFLQAEESSLSEAISLGPLGLGRGTLCRGTRWKG